MTRIARRSATPDCSIIVILVQREHRHHVGGAERSGVRERRVQVVEEVGLPSRLDEFRARDRTSSAGTAGRESCPRRAGAPPARRGRTSSTRARTRSRSSARSHRPARSRSAASWMPSPRIRSRMSRAADAMFARLMIAISSKVVARSAFDWESMRFGLAATMPTSSRNAIAGKHPLRMVGDPVVEEQLQRDRDADRDRDRYPRLPFVEPPPGRLHLGPDPPGEVHRVEQSIPPSVPGALGRHARKSDASWTRFSACQSQRASASASRMARQHRSVIVTNISSPRSVRVAYIAPSTVINGPWNRPV